MQITINHVWSVRTSKWLLKLNYVTELNRTLYKRNISHKDLKGSKEHTLLDSTHEKLSMRVMNLLCSQKSLPQDSKKCSCHHGYDNKDSSLTSCENKTKLQDNSYLSKKACRQWISSDTSQWRKERTGIKKLNINSTFNKNVSKSLLKQDVKP